MRISSRLFEKSLTDSPTGSPSPALRALFRKFNAKYFGGELPSIRVGYHWHDLFRKEKAVALTVFAPFPCFSKGARDHRIYFHPRFAERWPGWGNEVLLHEMIHVRLRTEGKFMVDAHGWAFRVEFDRVAAMGGFSPRHVKWAHRKFGWY